MDVAVVGESQMPDVHLELLGRPVVRQGSSGPVPVPLSLQPFLAFLSLERGSGCHRARLIDSLWPDVPDYQGRRRLNTAVWRTRGLFGAGHDGVIATRSGHVALDRTVLEIDIAPTIHALSDERRAAASLGDPVAIDGLQRAVLVDFSQFLPGNYNDWVVRARYQLELAIVNGVETLLEVASTPVEAMRWAELLVRLDPLREDAHRRLIRLYAEAGRRADAIRQYDACVAHLRDDLGVEPLIETTLAATAAREGTLGGVADVDDPQRTLRALRDALASCLIAVDRIETAIASLPPTDLTG